MKKRVGFSNVEKTRNIGLCTGCGTCAGVCPNSAIEMNVDSKGNYLPHINKEKCDQCGICFDTCPGHTVDVKQLNSFIFGKSPDDILIGNYINCYLGHSTDEKIRWNASSGGLVTTLLIFALEEGIIDGALVTRMSEKNPLEPEVIIARTKEEIISASQSKYCPVPVNIALKEILREDGKFAVVGLPCHIHGIRKAEMLNEKLKEKIVLHIGLFCGHTVNFLGTEFILQAINVQKEKIKKVTYRGKGFPGIMSIELKDGIIKEIDHIDFWRFLFSSPRFFAPVRCTLCNDCTCEFADISFGSGWLPELKGDKIGTSVCLSRTYIGEKIIQRLKSTDAVAIEAIRCNKIIQSESNIITFKKGLKSRIILFKLLSKKVPRYNSELFKMDFITYLKYILKSILLYLRIYISSKRYFWKFIRHKLHLYN